ncbi:MAG TPA: crosslink repair DNA glycosylase YcaQ family protein [Ktedonobacteraceae bacterium]
MGELPDFRVVMRRERDGDYGDSRIRRMAVEHAEAIDEMRAILRERGTVTNRDFAMASRTRTQSYRGRKDSALALYYLWYTGEVMTHHREHFERVYALTETVAPAHLLRENDEAEADRLLIKKDVSFSGLARPSRVAESFRGYGESDRATKQLLGAMVADGDLIKVQVEGWKAVHYVLGSDEAVAPQYRQRVVAEPTLLLRLVDLPHVVEAEQHSGSPARADVIERCEEDGLLGRGRLHRRPGLRHAPCAHIGQQTRPADQHVRHPGLVAGG